jgi:uncharacterized protein YdaU (DUF1376 family)
MPRPSGCPYFNFYPDDFSSDRNVEAMTTEEVGAYILLLCKSWREDPVATLPNDDRLLARWARLSPDRWAACKAAVLSCFRTGTDGRLYQKRLRLEYDRLRRIQKTRHEAAKVAANVRHSKQSVIIELDATRMRDAEQTDASRTPNACHTNSVDVYVPEFLECLSSEEQKKDASEHRDKLFEEFIGVAIAAGKGLNDVFVAQALRLWQGYDDGTHAAIVTDYKSKCTNGTWSDEQHTPYPHNYLKTKQWSSPTNGHRLLPKADTSKGATAQKRAAANFMKGE